MTDVSESIDLAERRNWAERCIEMGRLRDAVTIGPVEMLAILDRLRKAEARIEKVLNHDPLHGAESGFHCGGMASCIRRILTEGDEQ